MAVKIFDGNISGTCASMMMVFMLLFAMVSLPSPAPPAARGRPTKKARGHVYYLLLQAILALGLIALDPRRSSSSG
jgi:hypothetical protein